MTWHDFIGNTAGIAACRGAARLVLDLPDTTTDDEIEVARLRARAAEEERDEARRLHAAAVEELAAVRMGRVPDRETLARQMFDTSREVGSAFWHELGPMTQDRWCAAADTAINLIRPATDGDEVVRLKQALQLTEDALTDVSARSLRNREERDIARGKLAEMTANHNAASRAITTHIATIGRLTARLEQAEAAAAAVLKTVVDLRVTIQGEGP